MRRPALPLAPRTDHARSSRGSFASAWPHVGPSCGPASCIPQPSAQLKRTLGDTLNATTFDQTPGHSLHLKARERVESTVVTRAFVSETL